nr:alginate lyase family protein [Butyrivibrio sp. WCE2006]
MGYKNVEVKTNYHLAPRFYISSCYLDEDDTYIDRFKVDELLNNHIWLLNDMEEWMPGRWKYPSRTHLWNFNLHYFEYGIALAAIYKKTGNYDYYLKLTQMYRDWHKTCFDSKTGDAWHPYTISLRLKNLLIILDTLDDKKEEWIEIVGNDIYQQFQFLKHNKEKNLLGNHYFENLVTLYICSAFFQEDSYKEYILKELIGQINEQLLEDGMHFERSFMYHNLIFEDLIRIYKVSKDVLRNILLDKMQAMADCIFSFENSNRIPAFNDAASNVAKTSVQLLRAANSIAGIVPQYKTRLDYGGYFKLANGSFNVIVDAGDYAPSYISGHGHCDMMSFELFFMDEPILINAGTYQYQSGHRVFFRSTKSHNTIQVDGVDQSEIWGEHRTGRRAIIQEKKIADNSIYIKMLDYKRNRLERKILIDNGVVINDSASSQYTSYWHIYPTNHISVIDDNEIEIVTDRGTRIIMVAENGKFKNITNESWYSEEMGEIQNLPSFATDARTVKILKA